jgi:dihydrofolate reductase
MSKVTFDISMSLDGFMTASNQTAENPLGEHPKGYSGQRLHAWAWGDEEGRADGVLPDSRRDSTGALICGRRTYDTSLPWWGADGPSGELRLPLVVITHNEPAEVPAESVYTFAGNIEDALAQAREAAAGRDVSVMGGAATGQQFIKAGLVDEIVIHLVPVLLGRGTRMFDHLGPDYIQLAPAEVTDGAAATHLRYRVVGAPADSL